MVEVVVDCFLIAIQNEHLLVGMHDVGLGLEVELLVLDAFEERVDVLQGLLYHYLVVSDRRNDPVYIFEVERH